MMSKIGTFEVPICCPRCGCTDIIRRGKPESQKGKIQRYSCKNCMRRFRDTITHRSRFGELVVDRVLPLTAAGLRPRAIADEIARDSEEFLSKKIEISTQTIPRLVRRYVPILLRFERLAEPKHMSDLWTIDDMFERIRIKKGYKIYWIVNILDLRTRYCLASCVFPGRDEHITIEALKSAIQRAKRVPSLITCDEYQAQIRGIKNLLPSAEIDSKSKEESYGHINEIEAFNNLVRRANITRRGSRSLVYLQSKLDLFRFDYNFFRLHGSLEKETPASLAGIPYPQTFRWSELLRYARWFLISRSNSVQPGGQNNG